MASLSSIPVYRKYLLSPEKNIPLDFSKGLDESQEPSVLGNGYVAKALNWVPEPSGSLRMRVGWLSGPVSGLPSAATISGMGIATEGPLEYVSVGVANGTTGGGVYVVPVDFSTGWTQIDTLPASADLLENPVAFATGQNHMAYTHPGMTGIGCWGGNITSPAPTVVAGTHPCRALLYRPGSERFYAGGAADAAGQPYRLYFTNKGTNPALLASWQSKVNGAMVDNYIDVGADDGLPIEDLCLWDNNVLIAKRSGVWALEGDNPGSATLIKVDGATGSAGRCLVPTTWGLVVLGERDAWLWTGGLPQLLTKGVELTYLTMGADPTLVPSPPGGSVASGGTSSAGTTTTTTTTTTTSTAPTGPYSFTPTQLTHDANWFLATSGMLETSAAPADAYATDAINDQLARAVYFNLGVQPPPSSNVQGPTTPQSPSGFFGSSFTALSGSWSVPPSEPTRLMVTSPGGSAYVADSVPATATSPVGASVLVTWQVAVPSGAHIAFTITDETSGSIVSYETQTPPTNGWWQYVQGYAPTDGHTYRYEVTFTNLPSGTTAAIVAIQVAYAGTASASMSVWPGTQLTVASGSWTTQNVVAGLIESTGQTDSVHAVDTPGATGVTVEFEVGSQMFSGQSPTATTDASQVNCQIWDATTGSVVTQTGFQNYIWNNPVGLIPVPSLQFQAVSGHTYHYVVQVQPAPGAPYGVGVQVYQITAGYGATTPTSGNVSVTTSVKDPTGKVVATSTQTIAYSPSSPPPVTTQPILNYTPTTAGNYLYDVDVTTATTASCFIAEIQVVPTIPSGGGGGGSGGGGGGGSSGGATGDALGYITGAFINRFLYVARMSSVSDRVPVVDLSTGTWHVEKAPDPVNGVYSSFGRLYGASLAPSQMTPLVVRTQPNAVRAFDQGSGNGGPGGVSYYLLTPEYWLTGESAPTTVRHVWVRWLERQQGGGACAVRAYVDGVLQQSWEITSGGVGTHRARFDYGVTGYSLQLEFELPAQQLALDIEAIEIAVDPQPIR